MSYYKKDKNFQKLYNPKPFGYAPPKKENKIVFFVFISILVLTIIYVASYYVEH